MTPVLCSGTFDIHFLDFNYLDFFIMSDYLFYLKNSYHIFAMVCFICKEVNFIILYIKINILNKTNDKILHKKINHVDNKNPEGVHHFLWRFFYWFPVVHHRRVYFPFSTVSIKLLLSRAIFLTVEAYACLHAQARDVALGRLYIFAARKCNYTERAWWYIDLLMPRK
jgi:hypothetical protein